MIFYSSDKIFNINSFSVASSNEIDRPTHKNDSPSIETVTTMETNTFNTFTNFIK